MISQAVCDVGRLFISSEGGVADGTKSVIVRWRLVAVWLGWLLSMASECERLLVALRGGAGWRSNSGMTSSSVSIQLC